MTPKTTTTTQTAATTTIHARALLVWLTIATWSARKYDRQVSAKVNTDYNASADSGRFNKFLLPGDAVAYKALTALASQIRAEHYTHTLSWSDEGWRLLPTANYITYTDWFRKRSNELRNAVDAFVTEYPSLKANAKALAGKLYKEEDYPSIGDLKHKFSLSVEYAPLPAVGDIRVDLAADQIADIESSIQNRIATATTTAVNDCWQRLYDVVAKINERLADPKAIFRDSLIDNARELCELLPRLNVTDDPELERMRARVEKQLTMIDPDVLRDNGKQRKSVAAAADDILKQMSGLFEVA